ncbi:hypothetical protein NE865_14705 [Phthorimaea operculella]|nr:hypothetical protein NE865_14705 [Phthorimaea operculella]
MEDGTSAIESMGLGKQAKSVVKPRARYRYVFLLATACGAALMLVSLRGGSDLLLLPPRDPTPAWDYRPRAFHIGQPFTIDTQGCTIPALKPFDEHIKKFVNVPEVDPCRNNNFTLLESNDTHIWLQKEYLRYLGVDDDNVTCCYKPFYRPVYVENIYSEWVDSRIKYEQCTYFENNIEVAHEFVRVACEYELPTHEVGTYEQFFIFARVKPFKKRALIEEPKPQSQPSYNVLIMGIDAISRLNFHRTMVKTEAYLKKKGAVELMGYNKVGDNTFPNLTPLLLGVRESELPKTCWPHSKATFDNCPFVWEWFKDVGYYTALGEDNAMLGTFNFERRGFVGTPTDYYLHPFMSEAEKNSGNNFDFNSFLCMGNKYFYQVLLDYVESLTSTLKSSKLFGFFWEVTMSHDYLNYPMVMDDSYEKFLKNLDSSGYLEDTILIFMSDHGIRWGEIRYTKQGRLEERLPLVNILVPPSFRVNYSLAYDNLRLNSKRLTTPFDVHATLVDLVSMESIKNKNIRLRSTKPYGHDRSISLFLPVPSNRTCKMADIDDHWCTCHKGQKMATDSGEAREAAAHLPDNNETASWREWVVVVRVQPGGGVFEATVRRDARQFTLAGAVSRLNLYGEQSHCIHQYRLKLYCYCQ